MLVSQFLPFNTCLLTKSYFIEFFYCANEINDAACHDWDNFFYFGIAWEAELNPTILSFMGSSSLNSLVGLATPSFRFGPQTNIGVQGSTGLFDYSLGGTLGVEAYIEAMTLGEVTLDYPIEVTFDAAFSDATQTLSVSIGNDLRNLAAELTAESLGFASAGIDLIFGVDPGGFRNIVNPFGDDFDILYPGIRSDTYNIINITAGTSTELDDLFNNPLLDDVTLDFSLPGGEEDTANVGASAPGTLSSIGLDIDESIVELGFPLLELVEKAKVIPGLQVLAALDALQEDFSLLGLEAEYTLLSADINAGIGVSQDFNFTPDLDVSVNIDGQTISGDPGGAFDFSNFDATDGIVNGEITFDLNGLLQVDYGISATIQTALSALGLMVTFPPPFSALSFNRDPFSISGPGGSRDIDLITTSIDLSDFFEPISVPFSLPIGDGPDATAQEDIIRDDGKKAGTLSISAPTYMFDGDADYEVLLSTSGLGFQYNIAYIIDASGSMSGSRISTAKSAYNDLTNYLVSEGIADVSQFGVFSFGSTIKTNSSPLTAQQAVSAVNSTSAGGSTNFEAGLAAARVFFEGTSLGATNIAYFLSDGEVNAGGQDAATLGQLIPFADVRAFGIGNARLSELNLVDSNSAQILNSVSDLRASFTSSEIQKADVDRIVVTMDGQVIETILGSQLNDTGLGLSFAGSADSLNTSPGALNELAAQVFFVDPSVPTTNVTFQIASGSTIGNVGSATEGNDVIHLGASQTSIAAGDGSDSVSGNFFENTIDTGGGNDRIQAFGGNDTIIIGDNITGVDDNIIDGGSGIDTVRYSGNRADYPITKIGNVVKVGNGTDTLTNVEFVEFDDTRISTTNLQPVPYVEVYDYTIAEGTTGQTLARIPVTLSGTSSSTVQVNYTIASGTAIVGQSNDPTSDVVDSSGTLIFSPGEISKFIEIPIAADANVEGDETFTLTLSGVANATFDTLDPTKTVDVKIANDDLPSVVAFANLVYGVVEGDSGSSFADITVVRNGDTSRQSLVQVVLTNGNGVDGADFLNGLVTSFGVRFDPGQTTDTVRVEFAGDKVVEFDETITLSLTGLDNNTISNPVADNARILLMNDDADLYILPFVPSLEEGTLNDGEFAFAILRDGDSKGALTVNYAVSGVGASPVTADDFVGGVLPSGAITFQPGEALVTLIISASGDFTPEPDESFQVTISSPDATVVEGTAIAEIREDEKTYQLFSGGTFIGDGDTLSEALPKAVAGGNIRMIFDNAGSGGEGTISADGVTLDTRTGSSGKVILAEGVTAFTMTGVGQFNVSGNSGSSFIAGNQAGNLIEAGDGSDVVKGGGGADLLRGGDGADALDGEGGADILEGGEGGDQLNGGAGDTLLGGNGNDILIASSAALGGIDGGNGFDTLIYDTAGPIGGDFSSFGVEQLVGSEHGDGLSMSNATDNRFISGRGGDDQLIGGMGNDELQGGTGQDNLDGGAGGSDVLRGGGGNDVLSGGSGDALFGDEGDDTLYVFDIAIAGIAGGTGYDRLIYDTASAIGGDLSNLGVEEIHGSQLADGIVLTSQTENVHLIGRGGGDTLRGGMGNDRIQGGEGDDNLDGAGGSDVVEGGEGNDILAGGIGDALRGGDGNDTVYARDAGLSEVSGGNGIDQLIYQSTTGIGGDVSDLGFEIIRGSDAAGDGITAITANFSIELSGRGGDDFLRGGMKADILDGGEGNDNLDGLDGADIIRGGAGDDVITGGEGDSLDGGDGSDYVFAESVRLAGLSGGSGYDYLIYNTAEAVGGDFSSLGFEAISGSNVAGDALILSSSTDDVVVSGRGGDDYLLTGTGNDIVMGGTGNDNLNGGIGGFDRLEGEEGDDLLDGGEGDTLNGGAGSDTIIARSTALGGASGGSGYDRLIYETVAGVGGNFSGLGFEEILGSNNSGDGLVLSDETTSVVLKGRGGNDYLLGGQANDRLEGGDGNDNLNGAAGFDVLLGGDGDDVLTGGDGDTLDGGDGDDTFYAIGTALGGLAGGDGNDTLIYDTQSGIGGNFASLGIEAVIGSNVGGDGLSMDGATFSVSLKGRAGDDVLVGGSMADMLFGGDGADRLDGGDGADLLDGGDGGDYLSGGASDALIGGGGDDLIVSSSAALGGLDGGAGFDTLVYNSTAAVSGDFSSFSIEQIVGSEQDDTIIAASATHDIFLIGRDGDDTLIGGAGNDRLSGGSGKDTLDGRAGFDFLEGGDGDDQLLGGTGDTLDAGEGDDVLYAQSNALGGLSGGAGFDTLVYISPKGVGGDFSGLNIEQLVGSDHADALSVASDTEDRILVGRGGGDQIVGGLGNDTVRGDSGDDNLNGGAGGHDLIEGGDGNDTLVGDAGDVLRGNGDDDTLIALATNLGGVEGGDGRDTLIYETSLGIGGEFSGLGVEEIHGSQLADSISMELATDNVTILGRGGGDFLRGGTGNDTLLGGLGSDNLSGGDGADSLAGDEGDDTLFGGQGDSISGGAGDDQIIVDSILLAGLDGGEGRDTLVLDTGSGVGGNLSGFRIESLVGSQQSDDLSMDGSATNIELFGRDGDDKLVGGEFNDLLDGGNDDDVLIGGAGRDILHGRNGDDQIYIDSLDTVFSGGDGVDSLFLLDGGNFNIDLSATSFEFAYGGDGNETLNAAGRASTGASYGQGGDDLLIGGNVADLLDGGEGDDRMSGFGGDDFLFGGGGMDQVIYSGESSRYLVVDAGNGYTNIVDSLGFDGVDTLFEVESVMFSDLTLIL